MTNYSRILGLTIGAVAQTAFFGCSSGVDARPEPVRNIVFILIDDLGVMDLVCYGSDYYETPHLDALASQGMRFTEAYTAHPVCSPTRASILTGRYPARLHLTAFIPGREPTYSKLRAPDWIKYLRQTEEIYAKPFNEAGFQTFHVGKWHAGHEYTGNKSPGLFGFQHVVAGSPLHPQTPQDPHAVDRYTRAIEDFMERHRDVPFLAVLSHETVHVPIYDQPEMIEKYRNKPPGSNGQNNPVMAAMIERMDNSVGRVVSKIKELGLENNTAVIFFSDNGGLSSVYSEEHGASITATSNLPYRGGKSQIYEGGIRVPLIIKWPGVTAPGSVCDVPVISNDLYPTFLQMAGLPLMPEQHLDGLGLAPLLSQTGSLNRNTLYWHYPHYQTLPPHSAVRHHQWKLIQHHGEDARIELFNLEDDPGERHNLADSHPEQREKLLAFLHDHLTTIGAQMPYPNPNHDPNRHWRSVDSRGEWDPYEHDQDNDPRTYVTDPGLDYGAVR